MRNWAIVVGINEYPPAANQGVLKGAVADAADFADWALHPNGGDVAAKDLFFWTHPAPDDPTDRLAAFLADATPWVDIEKGDTPEEAPLEAMAVGRAPEADDIVITALAGAEAAKRAGGQHRIYVFFAGHGVQTTTIESAALPQTCFVTANFRTRFATRGLIPCDDLRNGLMNLGFSQVVMFLDCCRSSISLTKPPPSLDMNSTGSKPKPNYGVGRASDFGALAYEAPAGAEKRGAFSQVLLDGLRRHRDDGVQVLTLNALANYVSTSIGEVVKPNIQLPQFEIIPSNPQFEILKAPKIDPLVDIVVTFSQAFAEVVLKDGKTRVIFTFRNVESGQEACCQAPAGSLYSLETPDRTHVQAFPHTGPDVTHVGF
jgi:uncharacterized caspase-like protein